MEFSADELIERMSAMMWALMRVGAMISVMPVFSAKSVSMRIKSLLVVAITWAMLPVIGAVPVVHPLSIASFLISSQQILVGLVMGFILQLVFNSMVFAAQGISNSVGLAMATMMDPVNGVNVPVLGQVLVILTTLLFLMADGHLLLLEALAQSFVTLPISTTGIANSDMLAIVNWAGSVFASGVTLAIPTMGAVLTVQVGFGVITKTAPQVSIFTVGMPLIMLMGFIIIAVTLPSMLNQFMNLADGGIKMLYAIIVAKE